MEEGQGVAYNPMVQMTWMLRLRFISPSHDSARCIGASFRITTHDEVGSDVGRLLKLWPQRLCRPARCERSVEEDEA